MKSIAFLLPVVLVVSGCAVQGAGASREKRDAAPEKLQSLSEARRGFETRLIRHAESPQPAEQPPAKLFRLVRYPSPAGDLAAYVSVRPKQGGRRPAIIWLFGGFSNGIDATAWEKASPKNDQSASAFRKAGIVMMYPSLRGGVDNPGTPEGFFGEVDDVLAAADYLAQQDFVDPERIYLGGHSTGGTLALLAAASTDRFRAVFSFGPVEDVTGYGADRLPFDTSDKRECELRAPVLWMHSIRCPTLVLEGTGGNIESLRALQQASQNPLVRFFPVQGADHFNILAPGTKLLAETILSDVGPTTELAISQQELSSLFGK
jgi:dienelactone hydrolase